MALGSLAGATGAGGHLFKLLFISLEFTALAVRTSGKSVGSFVIAEENI